MGAGVAGLVTGHRLRGVGSSVLVLERLDLALKDKPCSGIIAYSSFEIFEKTFGRDFYHLIKVKSPNMVSVRWDGTRKIIPTPVGGVIRKEFDRQLADCYMDAGGALKDCIRIQQIDFENHIVYCFDDRNKEKLEIAYDKLIGADGACSSVRYRLTHKPPRLVTGLMTVAESSSAEILFEQYEKPHSYEWYIPIGKIAYIGFLYETKPEAFSYNFLKKTLFNYAKERGVSVTSWRGYIMPTGNDIFLEKDDCYFVGDAAGLIDSSSYGGIEIAFMSAGILAECLINKKSYTHEMKSLVTNLLKIYDKVGNSYNKKTGSQIL